MLVLFGDVLGFFHCCHPLQLLDRTNVSCAHKPDQETPERPARKSNGVEQKNRQKIKAQKFCCLSPSQAQENHTDRSPGINNCCLERFLECSQDVTEKLLRCFCNYGSFSERFPELLKKKNYPKKYLDLQWSFYKMSLISCLMSIKVFKCSWNISERSLKCCGNLLKTFEMFQNFSEVQLEYCWDVPGMFLRCFEGSGNSCLWRISDRNVNGRSNRVWTSSGTRCRLFRSTTKKQQGSHELQLWEDQKF